MFFNRHHSIAPSLVSFVAGALSASLIWSLGWCARKILLSHKTSRLYYVGSHGDNDVDSDDGSSDEYDSNLENESTSFRDKMRWPWDKIRRTVLTASASFLNMDFPEDTTSTGQAYSKTGPCIGAIFGLDVGGTLTKLVYFEQQIQEYKRSGSHEGLHRQEHYLQAASALEVLQARRSPSMMLTRHNTDSENDLRDLWGMRQESVPDRLDEFASTCNITHSGASLSPERVNSFLRESTVHVSDSHTTKKNQSKEIYVKKSNSMVNLSTSTEHAEVLDNFYSFARRLDTYETAVKDKHLSYYSRYLNGQFHFIRFETR